MPELPFAVGYNGRPTYGLPSTREVNVYVEQTEAGPKQAARIARPGLVSQYTIGTGPILRAFQNPGLFNADPFFVSGAELYRANTLIDSVPYGAQPRMAATNTQLAIVVGGALYVYTSAGLQHVTLFADGETLLPPFSGVAVLFNVFVFPVAGTNEFYVSSAGDATSIDASLVATAQTSPDPIIEVTVVAEELYFVKSRSTEIWDYNPVTNSFGQVTAVFQESQGRTYIRGTASQGSVVVLDNAMFWIGDDLEVYRSSNVPLKISTPFIDDRLRAAKATIDQTSAFAVGIEGHWLYVFNLPALGESYAYDCATKLWAQWGTQAAFQTEPGLFAGYCSAGQGGSIWIGSASDGKVWLMDNSTNLDDGLTRPVIASAALWTTGGRKRLNNVTLACVRGVGTADTPDPQVWMRLSVDGGRTFGSWQPGTLGPVGQYGYKAVWRSLGLIKQPGVLFEFRVLDPVNFTVEGASFNEARV